MLSLHLATPRASGADLILPIIAARQYRILEGPQPTHMSIIRPPTKTSNYIHPARRSRIILLFSARPFANASIVYCYFLVIVIVILSILVGGGLEGKRGGVILYHIMLLLLLGFAWKLSIGIGVGEIVVWLLRCFSCWLGSAHPSHRWAFYILLWKFIAGLPWTFLRFVWALPSAFPAVIPLRWGRSDSMLWYSKYD